MLGFSSLRVNVTHLSIISDFQISFVSREMMRTIGLLSFLLLACAPVAGANLRYGVNGGVDCAACTVAVGLVEQLSILYNETVVSSLERLCSFFPEEYQVYCKAAVEFLGKS